MQYFGGISATSPINLEGNLKIQFARILGAGPLFSLLFGGVFLFLFITLIPLGMVSMV
jgi:hypothetical protein